MKNLILTITTIITLSAGTKAQDFKFNKGDKLIEGSLTYEKANDKQIGENSSAFIFNPAASYFLTDKIALGINLRFGNFNDEIASENEYTKVNGYGIGVHGRYYFLELGNRFKTYTNLSFIYGATRVEELTNGNLKKDPTFNTFQTGIDIGFNFFITKKIALTYTIGELLYFQSYKYNDPNMKGGNLFMMNLNKFDNIFSQTSFGLSFKL